MAEITNESPRVELMEAWSSIPDAERGELIAELLDRSDQWHNWAISESFIVGWLRAKFVNAGISWPPDDVDK